MHLTLVMWRVSARRAEREADPRRSVGERNGPIMNVQRQTEAKRRMERRCVLAMKTGRKENNGQRNELKQKKRRKV